MSQKNESENGKGKCNFSHITALQREEILALIKDGCTEKSIADTLSVSKTSIARELLRNRSFVKNHSLKRNFCQKVQYCKIKQICASMNCHGFCKNCALGKDCNKLCKEYLPTVCQRLKRFPYVCDGCSKAGACTLDHYHYYPKEANEKSYQRLVMTRCGLGITEEQLATIDKATVNGTIKKQSIEHIFSDNSAPVTPRTIRNYIKNGIMTTTQSELPKGVICKPRNIHISKESQKQLKKAKEGRDLSAFLKYAEEQSFLFFTELDTVEGSMRDDDKTRLLTLIIVSVHLFICLRIPNGSTASIEKAFNDLYAELGHDDFVFLFGCLLTDNGCEFSKPEDIEFDKETGEQRSHVFFCHPYSSWEKGSIEVCHELLRRIIPKGTSLSKLTSEKTRLINNHINSYFRPESDGCAYDIFVNAFGERGVTILSKLHINRIDKNDVNLTPDLLLD